MNAKTDASIDGGGELHCRGPITTHQAGNGRVERPRCSQLMPKCAVALPDPVDDGTPSSRIDTRPAGLFPEIFGDFRGFQRPQGDGGRRMQSGVRAEFAYPNIGIGAAGEDDRTSTPCRFIELPQCRPSNVWVWTVSVHLVETIQNRQYAAGFDKHSRCSTAHGVVLGNPSARPMAETIGHRFPTSDIDPDGDRSGVDVVAFPLIQQFQYEMQRGDGFPEPAPPRMTRRPRSSCAWYPDTSESDPVLPEFGDPFQCRSIASPRTTPN